MSVDVSMCLIVNPDDGMNVSMIMSFECWLLVNTGLWLAYGCE